MSKLSLPTIIVAALVVLILLFQLFTFQVSFNETALRVRLGEATAQSVINRDGNQPGLKFRWPWPVDQIKRYDRRLRTLDTPETEVKTRDGRNVIVGTYAIWRIADPLLFYQRARPEKAAENQMRSRLSQAQAAVIGQKQLDYFVNLDRDQVDQNYTELLSEMKSTVAPSLLADYGIEVAQMGVRRISLPQEVTKEVFNAMIQERKQTAARYREEGKSRAEAIKKRAESDAEAIIAFAARKAQDIRSIGIQATTEIFKQIRPEDQPFYEFLRILDGIKASLNENTTIFIDDKWPFWSVLTSPPTTPGQIPTMLAPTPTPSMSDQAPDQSGHGG